MLTCFRQAFRTPGFGSRRLVAAARSDTLARRAMAYRLTQSTTLNLSVGDITHWEGDAIVNAANERMLGGGGVDGAIHRAAGPELLQLCKEVDPVEPGVRCPTGEARITGGADLPAAHVIHTVGPVYSDKAESEPLLQAAYRNSLKLANDNQLKSIAFPAISCGVFGYPIPAAAEVALTTCRDHADQLERVDFVLFSNATFSKFDEQAQKLFEQAG